MKVGNLPECVPDEVSEVIEELVNFDCKIEGENLVTGSTYNMNLRAFWQGHVGRIKLWTNHWEMDLASDVNPRMIKEE